LGRYSAIAMPAEPRPPAQSRGASLVSHRRDSHMKDAAFLIVGAGFAGSVVAERLASAGRRVLVVDRRAHVGGNCYDHLDEHGVLVHRYGGHIFHTNRKVVVTYLSRFTEWRRYEHKVLASVDGKLVPFPINVDTINKLYGLNLDEEGAKAFLEKVREPRDPVRTSEDVVISAVGRDLYEKFYQNYTRKHWGLDASELSASVAGRIPVRTNHDDRYFTDDFQAMPLHGYTKLFERILCHPNIEVRLGVDFAQITGQAEVGHTVYTGPIDEYFGFCCGKLPYRSLRIEHEHLPNTPYLLPVGTVNFPNSHEFNRIAEFKHMTGQEHSGTTVARDYPSSEGDPFYPIPRPENEALYRRYRALASRERNTTFVGRLAQYRYFNMDQVVLAALRTARRIIEVDNG